MELPEYLVTLVKEGKAVLLLGAGASMECRNPKGEPPPSGSELAALLSDRFLGGKYKKLPLQQVAEYAISESDLFTVQKSIRELFENFEPSQAHLLMSSFHWWGIAITNYDKIIEKAYEIEKNAAQKLRPFIENGDKVNEYMRDLNSVMLLKLHGCISRIANQACPLILTTDQYIEFRKGRSRIFEHLMDWAIEMPIIFIGHSIQDSDIRTLLLELINYREQRPRYYAVLPDADQVQIRYWEGKKVSVLAGTFLEFMTELDRLIPATYRKLTGLRAQETFGISEKFTNPALPLSKTCLEFLQTDVDYVKDIRSTEGISPPEFYKGVDRGWAPIEQNLDVQRTIKDTILTDNFLIEESDHLGKMEMILVKAHAGAGKSVLLRRIAWDAAREYDRLCLYLKSFGELNTYAIKELIDRCGERIYLFVDDAADRVTKLISLSDEIGEEASRLTVITAERINEWNISCERLEPLVTTTYELRYLSSREIKNLIDLLERHRSLGTLESATQDERISAFQERAGRQLLVALHEATLGKRFEDIIEDEYRNILPESAQRVYLSICVLNRLNVGVRAGIISRIHGISFEHFKEELFAPLEGVVQTVYDPIIRDHMYRARHPYIAEIVFDRILTRPEDRYGSYISFLNELNIDYSTDYQAFRQLIRARSLLDLFHDHQMVIQIYEKAYERVGEDPNLFHQMAIYERRRPDGNLQRAVDLLYRASELAPWDLSIKHSLAESFVRKAEITNTDLEKQKLYSQATKISRSLISQHLSSAAAHHTLIKIGLKDLEDLVTQSPNDKQLKDIQTIIGELESTLTDGLQKFPGDSYLLEADSRLAELLSDSARVITSLQQAFDSNPRISFIAIRLAHCYRAQQKDEEAQQILEKAIDANRNNRKLHFEYAKLRMERKNATGEELAYYLKRAFTPGDTYYDAQILYGRQLSINGNLQDSKHVFQQLRHACVAPEYRNHLRYPLSERFRGTVSRVEASYCFIAREGINDWIYAHESNIDEALWSRISVGDRLTFSIAFSMGGINAFDLKDE